jgi:tRNA 2-thiouridine synthesizing protein A
MEPNQDLIPRHVAWDAGEMGCGELVLELRFRLQDMPAGSMLELTANDPGAPEDLPAWCRMTGHELVDARHPKYWIRRRPEPVRQPDSK